MIAVLKIVFYYPLHSIFVTCYQTTVIQVYIEKIYIRENYHKCSKML